MTSNGIREQGGRVPDRFSTTDVACALAAAGAAWGLAGFLMAAQGTDPVIDDAYITCRMARNLVDGHGFVYNPGEGVLASSTPLYGLVLALGGLLAGSEAIPRVSWTLNLVLVGVAAFLLSLVLRRLGAPRVLGGVASVLAATNERMVDVAAGGMETPAYVVALAGFLLALHRRHGAASGLLAAVLTLVRPEGAAFAVLGLGWLAVSDRKALVRALVAGAVPGACWLAFSLAAYGSPVPQSVVAKVAVGSPYSGLRVLLNQVSESGWGLWVHLRSGLHVLRNSLEPWSWKVLLGASLNLACMAAAAIRWRRSFSARAMGAFVIGDIGLLAAGNPNMMPWYLAPLEVFYVLFIALGAWAVIDAALRGRVRPRLASVASFVPLAVLAMAQASHFGYGDPLGSRGRGLAMAGWDREREAAYREAIRAIARTGRGREVAGPEIGVLGWEWPGPILDTMGLASPEAVPHLVAEVGAGRSCAVPPALVEARRPDWVVVADLYLAGCPEGFPIAGGAYRLHARIPLPGWTDVSVLVFESTSGPP